MFAAFHTMSTSMSRKLRCLGGTHHQTTLKSLSNVHYVAMPITELVHLIGPHADIIASTDGRRSLLLNLPWSDGLSKREVDALAFACKPGLYSDGDIFIQKGDRLKHIHLIVSGEVKVTKPSTNGRQTLVYTACASDVLGEREVVTGHEAGTTATAAGDHVFCLLLEADDYANLAPSRKALALERGWPQLHLGKEHELHMHDFNIMAVIGSGAFAQVALLNHKPQSRSTLSRR